MNPSDTPPPEGRAWEVGMRIAEKGGGTIKTITAVVPRIAVVATTDGGRTRQIAWRELIHYEEITTMRTGEPEVVRLHKALLPFARIPLDEECSDMVPVQATIARAEIKNARAAIAAYDALPDDETKAERDELAIRLVAERDAHLEQEQQLREASTHPEPRQGDEAEIDESGEAEYSQGESEAFEAFWTKLTRNGDPDRLLNPVRYGFAGGYDAGFLAARSSLTDGDS